MTDIMKIAIYCNLLIKSVYLKVYITFKYFSKIGHSKHEHLIDSNNSKYKKNQKF